MNQERLDEIKARLDALTATCREFWRLESSEPDEASDRRFQAERAFIANAPADVRDLQAEVERLQKAIVGAAVLVLDKREFDQALDEVCNELAATPPSDRGPLWPGDDGV